MNFRQISLVIVILLSLLQIVNIYWLFVIVSCVSVFILAVCSVFLSSLANESSVKSKISRNPLDDHKTQTKLGINFSEISSKSDDLSTYSKKIKNKSLTGTRTTDELLGNLLDYVFRDFIEVWFQEISNNKTFPNEGRRYVESLISDITKRVIRAPLLSVLTTKVIDDVAAHVKVYNFVTNSISEPSRKTPKIVSRSSPFHRRNKSDTDACFRNWNLGSALIHKKVANSTFYSVQTDEELLDPEKQFIETFFDNSEDDFRNESKCDESLEKHFALIIETMLYYSMEPEIFKCDITRHFLTSLLGGLMKTLMNTLSDPDFINLQIAHIFVNDPPPAEFFIREIRQCNDLSELRAIRHLVTREMDLKHKNQKYAGEVASLKFTQNEIDKKISSIQNSNGNNRRNERDKNSSKTMKLTLDEIFNRDLAMSYFFDYLSILNLQKYIIFYRQSQEWKNIATEKLAEGCDDADSRKLRDTAFNLYTEYLLPNSSNYLKVDQGLIDVLHIKIKDTYLQPDPLWFDSIGRFIYEKIKNEDVFLSNFYESPAYKKLLVELEEIESEPSLDCPSMDIRSDASDTNSDDFVIDDEIDFLSPTDTNTNPCRHQRSHSDTGILVTREQLLGTQQRLTAKIIDTAIDQRGNFAVYAIEVHLSEKDTKGFENKKSWHIYHRYSRFLELKKLLLRRFPFLQNNTLPFPKKQTFHNTSRNLIERRMVILNEFLRVICNKAEHNDEMHNCILNFLKISDELDIPELKSVKHSVNPVKAGISAIKNMPESLGIFDGLQKIFQKNNEKPEIVDEMDTQIQLNAEFPALISFVNLIDIVFGLGTKSQWLKKAISGIMAAPFVSQSINKRILEIAQKHILDHERVESVLCGILNSVWPNGIRQDPFAREDVTKLRTRMAARVALFAFLSDDLKHFLGTDTTRIGLTNIFEILQNQTLNKRLILVIIHRLLTTIYPTKKMTKHFTKID